MPVRSVVAAPVVIVIFFLSLDSPCTASATEDVVRSMMESSRRLSMVDMWEKSSMF